MNHSTEMEAAHLLRLYGCTEAPNPLRRLSAGGLSCLFDDGAVRYLSWQGTELIRSVSYLLRDTDWGTAPSSVRKLQVEEHDSHFKLRFELAFAAPQGELLANASIEGDAGGQFRFVVEATASTSVRTNRCGFVVLHPCNVAGAPLGVEHTDGAFEEAVFPAEISPCQPVLDIRSLHYSPRPGLSVECHLEAELPQDPRGRFEMEDQRNWSDASFKTYVGSLLDPWPYDLPEGRRLRQSVQVSVTEWQAPATATPIANMPLSSAPPLRIGSSNGQTMPAIGLGVHGDPRHLSVEESDAVIALRPAWLVAELDLRLADINDLPHMIALRELAAACGAKVQLDLICPADDVPAALAVRMALTCRQAQWRPDALRPCPAPYLQSFQPGDRWPDLPALEQYARAFGEAFPGTAIGGGMLTYFTELNRKRPPAAGLAFIGHTTCPIVHAADDLSVMETLESLPQIVHSVRMLWPTLAYRLGPVSLAMHRNPYGKQPAANPQLRRMAMADNDPRHQGRFGAAWLAGYACAVAPLDIEVLSFNQAQGSSGPLMTQAPMDAPSGLRVPAWGVQQALARAGGATQHTIEGLPPGVVGLAWSASDGTPRVLLANLSAVPRLVGLQEPWQSVDLSQPTVPNAPLNTPSLHCSHRRELHLEGLQVLLLQS
jgi:D-apionolactonase